MATVTEERTVIADGTEARRALEKALVVEFKEKGYSNVAIGKIMKKSPSTVRNLLKP